MSNYLETRTAGMSKSERAAYIKFDNACKRASKCRDSRKQISCMSCKDRHNCSIQEVIDDYQRSAR